MLLCLELLLVEALRRQPCRVMSSAWSEGRGLEKGFLAVLCPCGETTSKRSRASHFWASPQMLFEKEPAAANCGGGFCTVSTSN